MTWAILDALLDPFALRRVPAMTDSGLTVRSDRNRGYQ
jgi:hypothetical protein